MRHIGVRLYRVVEFQGFKEHCQALICLVEVYQMVFLSQVDPDRSQSFLLQVNRCKVDLGAVSSTETDHAAKLLRV